MIDKRLTAEEKKKIKPVNQGGGPNYLGKQEMVTAPKKWLSDPDHVVAELAYITPKEKEMLIKADIYGSLKGTPNKGPSGIQSLQGDLGGYDASPGGPNAGGGGGGGGNRVGQVDKNKQAVQDILTGKTVTGQTAAKGPRTKQYSDLPEYMKVKQDDGTYKDTYVGSAYKSYGTPSFFGNLFSRGAPGYRGIKGLSAFGDPMKNYKVDMGGSAGPGYYTDKTNFTEMNPAIPPIGIVGILSNLFGGSKKPSMYDDMSQYNKLGLYTDRVKGYTRPEGYEFLDNEEQAAIDLELFNKGMYTDDYKDMYGLGMDDDGGITTIAPVNYSELVEKFLPQSTMPEDEDLLGGFKSRFLQNRTQEEREAIEDMINEKFKYDYNSFGLGDMDGS